MIKSLLEWFKDTTESEPSHTVELATAVLLSEIIRADNRSDEREMAMYHQILAKRFSLGPDALEALKSDGLNKSEHAVDLVQFTRIINDRCTAEDKVAIVQSLWELAYADDTLDPIEEHLIRKIADLLYVSHSHFIQAKLSAKTR